MRGNVVVAVASVARLADSEIRLAYASINRNSYLLNPIYSFAPAARSSLTISLWFFFLAQ